MQKPAGTADRQALRGLILDFAGVLTADPDPTHRSWAESEGLHPEAWGATLNDSPDGRRLYSALEIGQLGQAEWNAKTAALLGAGIDPTNLMGRAWSKVPAAQRMAALARAAKEAGYRLALLSNSFGLDPFNPYEHVGIWDLFDVHVISEAVGLAKPDPAIYQLTLDRLDLPGEACVFVDDHPVNLPPAEAFGIATVLAMDEDDTVAELECLLGVTAAVSVRG
ncbi:HAD-IA family hydrolase [Streptomyces atratus]|jgi:putative hydrolase of the HAD superfamily|uniref:Putative hydrolase of the HAD superfamily n=1 Tax=Streptomyces atratus TaxID=1893 RepID=A0A1K2DUP5_STRAR|nr:HAD-IA family hydrolase [Streptomyces atratus]SFY26598.1 putative hydrolase of the HAD superfamily [Streptomyces atratus]